MATYPLCVFGEPEPATHFCACTDPETFLCSVHIPDHEQVCPTHTVYPLEALKYYTVPGYIDRLTSRRVIQTAAERELRTNIASIDRCIRQLSDKVEAAVWGLTLFAKKAIEGLMDERRKLEIEIETSIAEAQSALYQESPALLSRFAGVIRTFSAGDLVLFAYELSSDEYPHVEDLLTYRFRGPREPQAILAIIAKTELKLWDWNSHQWGTAMLLTQPVPWDDNSRYTVIDAFTLFCCGYSTR